MPVPFCAIADHVPLRQNLTAVWVNSLASEGPEPNQDSALFG